MKAKQLHTLKILLFWSLFIGLSYSGFAQNMGRVVINEYLPWTSNGCGSSAEFVELMNFGPGPVNIGCYILTDGDYSITIPANTVLKAGEFYVISGQSVIPFPCANIDSTISVNLNWNTCGCTSQPIPTTGDGFFTDGGSASEQVVLLDPNLNVVDAVIRSLPAEPSSLITTSGANGCSSKTFDLDLMTINYEIIGESAGRGNSFARKLDGDCGWVKDPQQSGHATNNTPSEASAVEYSFSFIDLMDCKSTLGRVDVYVRYNDYASIFPMNYTLACDINGSGTFDLNDQYVYGTDNTAPNITISGLAAGFYRLTLSSSKGCFLKTFDFWISPCTMTLPVKLLYFREKTTAGNHSFEWAFADADNLKNVALEKSSDGNTFIPQSVINILKDNSPRVFIKEVPEDLIYTYYRLKIVALNGKTTYSQVLGAPPKNTPGSAWPNPAVNILYIGNLPAAKKPVTYKILTSDNKLVRAGTVNPASDNRVSVPVGGLMKGIYQLILVQNSQPIFHRFVKQ